MPHLARHLAIAACLTLLGSVADAAPQKRGGKVAKATVDHDDDADEDSADDAGTDDDAEDAEADDAEDGTYAAVLRKKRKTSRGPVYDWRKRARERRLHKKERGEQVGFVDDTDRDRESTELVDAPVEVRRKKKGLRDWHVSIGPNVWLASVDANVEVGAKGVGTAIDFFQLSRHTKYGVPILLEARYKRFSFVTDVLYGVVAIDSAPKEVGPLMVKLDAEVSNLSVDGHLGYRVWGGDDAVLTVEPRAGIRYQRMAITGSVGLSGNEIAPPTIVDAGADMLVGARVTVRPYKRVSIVGTADQSLFGSSTSTWSVGGEANVRITSWVLLAAGYKTLTQQKSTISTVMHGPRFSIQLMF